MIKNKKFTEEILADCIRMYKLGNPVSMICKKHSVGRSRLFKLISELGLTEGQSKRVKRMRTIRNSSAKRVFSRLYKTFDGTLEDL